MIRVFRTNPPVVPSLVRHETAFASDVVPNNRRDAGYRMTFGMERTSRTAAFDQRDHHVFVVVAAPINAHALLPSDVSFVRFHD